MTINGSINKPRYPISFSYFSSIEEDLNSIWVECGRLKYFNRPNEKMIEDAKKEAENKYKQEQIEKYKLIEEAKMKQEEQSLQQMIKVVELEEKWIDMINKVQDNCNKDSELCSICFDNDADTAIVPCGHKYFCYNCIANYNKAYSNKGCPVCRKGIVSFIKIFSA